jgi:transcriptional regulator with XRE-family HTH domain
MTTNVALPRTAPALPARPKKSPDPIDKHVGLRVRMRRMALGLSQEKLADALGLTFQQVQKYESGINCIGASRLAHIAHTLQVAVPFFFEGAPGSGEGGKPGDAQGGGQGDSQGGNKDDGKGDAGDPTLAFAATKDGLRLITAYGAIKDAEKRKTVVWLAEIFAGALRAR